MHAHGMCAVQRYKNETKEKNLSARFVKMQNEHASVELVE